MKQRRLEKIPAVGENAKPSKIQVADLMTSPVITVTRFQTIGHVHSLLAKHTINALPVVDDSGEAVGILTSSDLVDGPDEATLVGKVMTKNVYTVPQYSGPDIAARTMRNHKLHHLIVTHEKKVVGILSAFDLLELIEEHRFTMKNAPSRPKKGGGKRRKEEGKADE